MSDKNTEKKIEARHTDGGILRFVKMMIMAIKRFREPYYNGFAGQISFYLCLSMVPMLMVISQILTALDVIPLERVLEMVKEYSGDKVPDIVNTLLSTKMTISSNIMFIVLSCWSASKAQFAISRVANYTLSNGKTTGKGYFVDRFRAVLTMMITIFAICLALLMLIYGEQILVFLANLFNSTLTLETDMTKIILRLRWPAFMLMFFLILSVNYYIMPTIHVKFRDVMPGALLSTIGMILVTLIFSRYVSTIANYNIIYGSLASIAALLMWFYLIAWAIGVGVMCNKLATETRPYYVSQRREERRKARKQKRKKGISSLDVSAEDIPSEEIPEDAIPEGMIEEAGTEVEKEEGTKIVGTKSGTEAKESEDYQKQLKEDIKEMIAEEVESGGIPKKVKEKVIDKLKEDKAENQKTEE